MCGIAGFFSFKERSKDDLLSLTKAMTDQISHRGPDDDGLWIDDSMQITLGHRRLSIIDLSPTGHQPMLSDSGRYVMVFNGEIYNFQSLKSEIEKVRNFRWKGTSDTEVMLNAFELFGIQETLQKISGMFAFAVCDLKDKKLFLARDRVGEKPLYFGFTKSGMYFGSELKVRKPVPDVENKINLNALQKYFRYGYISGEEAIFENTYKINAGCYAEIDLKDKNRQEIEQKPYWVAKNWFEKSNKYSSLSYEDALNQLESTLKKVVSETMISDVPLGSFLSGGVDSSLVTALMQANSSSKVKTFSVGFDNPKFNEAEHAKRVAQHLGTEHTEMYVSEKDALKVVPDLAKIYDEPFSDSSQIPTYLVCKLAKKHVTVALSGDGGDELFAGYTRYQLAKRLGDYKKFIPNPISKSILKLISALPNSVKNIDTFGLGEKLIIAKKAAIILSGNKSEIYDRFIAVWKDDMQLIQNSSPISNILSQHSLLVNDSIKAMQYADFMTYLPDDIMVKVDRAAMAASLETRAPLLDHRVVEFAASIPTSFKMNNSNQKIILKDLLYKYVPKEIIDRPKMGFGVPLDSWIRGDLRDWAHDLLSEKSLNSHSLLNNKVIHEIFTNHLAGDNEGYRLWNILMFQAWYQEYLN